MHTTTPTPLYSVGDSVRFVSDDETRFATIEHVDAIWRRYAVVYTRGEQLLDTRELVAHDACERYRKSTYAVDDVVELYPETSHEGPHESDVDNVSPVARVLDVHTHPNNDEWVVGYTLAVYEPAHDAEEQEAQHVERVKPGSIARLATSRAA
jgi:hypothetical protein